MFIFKDLLETVKEFDSQQIILCILLFTSIIAPGFMLIYLYEYHLFMESGILKLLLFSICLSAPIFLFNMFITIIGYKSRNKTLDKDKPFDLLFDTAIITSLIFFILILIYGYLLNKPFQIFLLYLITIELFCLGLELFILMYEKIISWFKKRKK
ncbi:MAG: Unknown protein [uncultured Campylobacterales bacterium]|uniref:Uncharacterized protein n=1 Tax=uncultured Campylobacterales bacterium TaxID=352960 RepID=A0A6S6TCB4_9BACT|nr:MAG: Unknown protein [uncultured Campylobacterales bacterium]